MFAATTTALPLDQIDELQNQMDAFAARFNALMTEKKTSILTASEQHNNQVNDLQRQIERLEAEIEANELRKEKTIKMINDTVDDLHAKNDKVEDLRKQLRNRTEVKELLDSEVKELKAELSHLEELLKFSQTNLNEQLARDVGELTKYEMYLGLRIEAVDIDLLKFRFGNIDANDIDKEVWCELSVGEERYRVVNTEPSLPTEKVAHIENLFNEHGEFLLFLKSMRSALRDAA